MPQDTKAKLRPCCGLWLLGVGLALCQLPANAQLPVNTFKLATTITHNGDTATLVTSGYAKLNFIQASTALSGMFYAHGQIQTSSPVTLALWVNVNGRYYFSKLPQYQNFSATTPKAFTIPFNAAEQTASEVFLEVETMGAATVSISGFDVNTDAF